MSKYAPRGYSGEFVTIYPAGDAGCERILTELGETLDGLPNPYILSDLRWGACPLHVRYGAFASRHTVSEDGAVVPALAAPDGTLVADRRTGLPDTAVCGAAGLPGAAPGCALSRAMGTRYPLTDHTSTPEDNRRDTAWAQDIHRQVRETVDAIHARGIVYGDLHMFNILIRPDDTIALPDFEVSCDAKELGGDGLGRGAVGRLEQHLPFAGGCRRSGAVGRRIDSLSVGRGRRLNRTLR